MPYALCFGTVTWATRRPAWVVTLTGEIFIDELKNEPRKVVKSVCLSYEKIFAHILKFKRRPEVFF